MAQSLSDEEFGRMQVYYNLQFFCNRNNYFPVENGTNLCLFQAQLIDLRTANYELESNCKGLQSGKHCHWSIFDSKIRQNMRVYKI